MADDPTWGADPWKSALPKIIQGIASDAAKAGGQGSPGLHVAVAMMADDSVQVMMTAYGMGPVEEWLKSCAPDALAVGIFTDNGTKLVRKLASRELADHVVPDWLRG